MINDFIATRRLSSLNPHRRPPPGCCGAARIHARPVAASAIDGHMPLVTQSRADVHVMGVSLFDPWQALTDLLIHRSSFKHDELDAYRLSIGYFVGK